MRRVAWGLVGALVAARALEQASVARRELRALAVMRRMGIKGTQTSGRG